MMKYQDPPLFNRQDAEKAFSTTDVKSICEALVSVAFNDSDWKWVQNKCLEFLSKGSPEVRGVAVTCLGHIARIHRQLDKEKVFNALRRYLDDSSISGQVEDTLDDIDMFVQ